jgi:hypothetical protein
MELTNGWVIGCSDYREKQPPGFGCWLAKCASAPPCTRYKGASWEWYDLRSGNDYVKRQGRGSVSLRIEELAGLYSMASLTFHDDTVFRADLKIIPIPGFDTHELHIAKGSVLPLTFLALKHGYGN